MLLAGVEIRKFVVAMNDENYINKSSGCCPDIGCPLEMQNQYDDGVVALYAGIPIWKLLCCPWLSIPNYQRQYCWVRKQIEGLLESIGSHSWNVDGRLHLGTVVLHQTDEDGDCTRLHIVDGQQRMITLTILFYNWLKHWNSFHEGEKKDDPQFALGKCRVHEETMARHVHWASRIIKEWLSCHSELSSENMLSRLQSQIQVDAVIVKGRENLGKVYTFFNAINSSGKKLTDYDLLKPHHLRYLTDKDPKAYFASEWDRFVQAKVCTFGSGKEATASLAEELLDVSLYRLRRWSRNRQVLKERHHVFEHFRAFAELHGENVSGWSDDLKIGLGGGQPFFDFVRHYAERYRRFLEAPAVVVLHAFNSSHRHLILLHFIRAFLFMYFCKFGDVYLDDALVFIMERVGRLRSNERIDSRRIFNDPLLAHTAVALDESPSPRSFFAYCIMQSNRYAHVGVEDEKISHIRPSFWNGVKETILSVKSRMAFWDDFQVLAAVYKIDMEKANDK